VSTSILGVDIGGANLKYATEDGRCFERSFAMWRRSDELADQLQQDIARFSGIEQLAVTMTGELADCFASRAAGVLHIVDHVVRCLPDAGPHTTMFYATDGRFHDAGSAKENWECVAASNWHALARCIGERIAPNALLIDIGSTTTDVIAICDGDVLTRSRTDHERLTDRSLVYIGCRRTPVCSLISEFEFRGMTVPVMNELFATIDDARLLLGIQADDPDDCETADGHPRDRVHAQARMARMIGLDRNQITDDEAISLGQQVHDCARKRIDVAVESWWRELLTHASDAVCVLSGHGQDLIEPPDTSIDLRVKLPRGVSRGAPSWAVAVLMGSRNGLPSQERSFG
jgi:probable H4MPT-linked C1 transfer pathway protein